MSDEDVDKEFRRVVDSFIDLANKHSDTIKPENVSMALLYAASRYNSFIVATRAPDLNKFEADRGKAFEFFVAEYKKMLTDNLDDHRKFYNDLRYADFMKNN